MKKLYLLIIFLTFAVIAQAQHIAVKDFYYVENDLTARTYGTSVEDQNGNQCALIKVETTEKGVWSFDVGMLGVSKTEFQNATHPAEIWVYVPFGVTWISIQHNQLGKLSRFQLPCSIERGCTYVMQLTTGKVTTIVEEEVRMQYLAFQISPANSVLEVDGQLWEVGPDGSSMKFVDFGTYTYSVKAPNYQTVVGKVIVNDPEKAHKVSVTLKSDYVKVTLQVDADAEIWVNDEKKGIRSWTGSLGKGSYKIECKQAGHETTTATQRITADMEGQTIKLHAPKPIYGSLIIESTPFATLYIDGNEVGETPMFIKEILTGEHELRLSKDGFIDFVSTILIKRGDRQQVKAEMERDVVTQVSVDDKPKESFIVDPETNTSNEKRVIQRGFRKKGFVLRPEIGYSLGYSEFIGPIANLSLGYQFGPRFYLGAVGGYYGYDKYEHEDSDSTENRSMYSIPFGLDIRWYLLDRNNTPVVGLEIGLHYAYYIHHYYSIGETVKGGETIPYIRTTLGYAFKNLEVTLGVGIVDGFHGSINLNYRFGFSSFKGKNNNPNKSSSF